MFPMRIDWGAEAASAKDAYDTLSRFAKLTLPKLSADITSFPALAPPPVLTRSNFQPMSLTLEDTQRIAKLARVELSATDCRETQRQLNGILGFIEQLQAVDTQGIEPMSHAVDAVLRLRPDVVAETDRRDDFQAIAPDVEDGLYLVPKVIE